MRTPKKVEINEVIFKKNEKKVEEAAKILADSIFKRLMDKRVSFKNLNKMAL